MGFSPPGEDEPRDDDFLGAADVLDEASVRAARSDTSRAPALLCRTCVEPMDVSGASISLHGGEGVTALWRSSDETASKPTELRYMVGDGPCRRAIELIAPVIATDLSNGQDAARGPVFAQEATRLGVSALFSLPLGSTALAIGSLDLYRNRPGVLSARDRAVASIAADAVTAALLAMNVTSVNRSDPGGDGRIENAESDREEVHQAAGMVMVQRDLDPQQALALLRAYAFTHGKTASETAHDVIAGKVTFDEQAPRRHHQPRGRRTGMNREHRVVEAFVSLTDATTDDVGPMVLLRRLVALCVDLTQADAAGFMPANPRGGLRGTAVSDDSAAIVEMFQSQTAQGPCVDCWRTQELVAAPDLSQSLERWPRFVPLARAAGFSGAHGLPARVADQTVGALNLLSATTTPLDPAGLERAQALTDVTIRTIMRRRPEALRPSDIVTQTQATLALEANVDMVGSMLAAAGRPPAPARGRAPAEHVRGPALRTAGRCRPLHVIPLM